LRQDGDPSEVNIGKTDSGAHLDGRVWGLRRPEKPRHPDLFGWDATSSLKISSELIRRTSRLQEGTPPGVTIHMPRP
jgi:hypothetical protein